MKFFVAPALFVSPERPNNERGERVKRILRQTFTGTILIGAIGGCFFWGRAMRVNVPAPTTAPTPMPVHSRLFAKAGTTPFADVEPSAANAENALPVDVFDEALERIQRDFALASLDGESLDEAMLSRLIAGIKDPATRAFNFRQNRVRRLALLGNFEGIGANWAITRRKQGEVARPVLTVQSVVAGSPAESAGLKTGDQITEIDGRWIIGTLQPDTLRSLPNASDPKEKHDDAKSRVPRGITLLAARELLNAGSNVTRHLTVERLGQPDLLKVEVRTAQTQSPAAAFQWEEPGIGHLTIRRFNQLASDFVQAVLTQHEAELRGLVVDLRQCSGGIQTGDFYPEANGVSALKQVLAQWLPTGTAALLETRARRHEPLHIEGKGKPSYSLVVLIDQGTANLGEVAASGLRDLGKAKIIGTPSFGDAILTYYAELKSGAALEIASAHLLTAKGKPMDKGILPDITAAPENALAQATKLLQAERKFAP